MITKESLLVRKSVCNAPVFIDVLWHINKNWYNSQVIATTKQNSHDKKAN